MYYVVISDANTANSVKILTFSWKKLGDYLRPQQIHNTVAYTQNKWTSVGCTFIQCPFKNSCMQSDNYNDIL